MRVEGQSTTRPHQSPTENLPRPIQGRSNDRNVESLPTLESLLNKIAEFFEDVATELKPIGSYLCQVLTLKNFMRAASDIRHETEQATIDVKLKYTDSRSERFRLKARKEMNEFKHDLKNGWADFKDDVKSGWDKLVK
ncbi:hypothetical protein [Endozoicomonas arenosclerae]|uniref:hypothetical protein n=1 Tax=Endozoicomonas arenosclerae TaxID=1633495 RepID=UPI0007852945|nr:hypothetical protein [Endozoicomonas arenosclerae]